LKSLVHLFAPVRLLVRKKPVSGPQLHPDNAVFIDVFAIVIADKLDHLIVRHALESQGVNNGFSSTTGSSIVIWSCRK